MKNQKIISRIRYNFSPATSDGKEQYGETWKEFIVGKDDVTQIHEHISVFGDKWFYDVEFSNGRFIRIFNPNEVFYEL